MNKAFQILQSRFGLEIERDEELVSYYKIQGDKKIYFTNATLNSEGNLLAYVSQDKVTILNIKETTEVLTRWHIQPANDEPLVGKLKFYDDALIILYHDLKTYHLAKLYIPKADLEFEVKVIQLGLYIHLGKDIIYYEPRGLDMKIHSIKLPELEKLTPVSKEEAKSKGIITSYYPFFELDNFEL